ncbi:MAG: hypothetical protein Q8O82_08010 [Pseudorhodobacter sp.]|nr:hypothetical protein [Pseudorhodobacter sp.]
MTRKLIFGVAMVLAGCVPVQQAAAPDLASEAIVGAPIDGVELAVTPTAPGLEAREPDLCHAIDYVPYLSQPGTVIETLGIVRAYRVVPYRGIEEQVYDPARIIFRLDPSGNIFNIDCG